MYPRTEWIGGKCCATRELRLWHDLMRRTNPSRSRASCYLDCTTSEDFKDFQYFADWCNRQIGFNRKESNGRWWQLDKDILCKGNKHYSADTCVFIPNELNVFTVRNKARRGNLPIGVSFDKSRNKYQVHCGKYGQRNLGRFDSVESAFSVYKVHKEALAKELAKKYSGSVDGRVIDALMNYTVSITD